MYKNPKEFTDIEDMVSKSYIELSSHIPLRDSRRYKSSCMKYIKEVPMVVISVRQDNKMYIAIG